VTVPLSSAVGDLLVFHDAPPRLFNAERGQGLEGLLSQAPFQRRPPRRPIVLRGSDCVLRMPGRPTDALSIRALPWPFPAWLRLAPESGQTLLTGLGIEQREGLAARLEDRWHGRLSGLARELRKRPGQALVVCEHPRTLSLKVDTGAAPARGHLRLRLLGGAVYGQDGRYQLRRPRALELLVYEPDMQLAVAPPSGQD